jgi:hypothetical protein
MSDTANKSPHVNLLRNKTLLNVVFFQALWLSCVAGAGMGYAWAGLPVLLIFAAYHAKASAWPRADLALVLFSVVLGVLCDSALIQLGFLRFQQPIPSSEIAPVWIAMLWVGFAMTLNHSMAFFKTRLIAATVFGLLGGPLAYWVANHAWKAVTFTAPDWQVYTALAVIWAVLTPLLLRIGDWLIRRLEPSTT